MKRSKRYRELQSKIDSSKNYSIGEAVGLIKEVSKANFDETVEMSFKLGVDPRHADQQIRGSYSLPKGIGKSMRVIVFAEGEKAEQAKEAGAIEVGGQDLVGKVEGGFFDFDVAIAVPSMMRFVGRLGRTLGPKGLMPSPKSGTVTEDVESAVKEFAAGKIEYRTDKTGNIHVPVGKSSFPSEDLEENMTSFVDHLIAAKPASSKGRFIQTAVVSTSMSPGIRLQIDSK